MSLQILEVILMADCPAVEKLVLLTIAKHGKGANGSGGYPGLRRIAQIVGISRSTLHSVLATLRAKRWLSWTSGSPEASNIYRIYVEAIPMLDLTRSASHPDSVAEPPPWLRERVTRGSTPDPVAEPEASTKKQKQIPNPSPKSKPSEADPRHGLFKKSFMRYYRQKVGTDPPWDGREGAALSKFLTASPQFTHEQWLRILDNRTLSPNLPHADRLSVWINTRALAWLNGPADQWGTLISGANAHAAPNRASDRGKPAEVDYRSSFRIAPGTNVGKL
jgi:hypothetical protein